MKIHIRDPFYGAFSKFLDWNKGDPGIGIAYKKIKYCIAGRDNLVIRVGKDETEYEIDPLKFYQKALKHKAKYIVRDNVVVYLVPMSFLNKFKVVD